MCVGTWLGSEALARHVEKSFMLIIYIVLPQFAILSRLDGKGMLTSTYQWDLQQYYVYCVCISIAASPSPSEKVGRSFGRIFMLYPGVCVENQLLHTTPGTGLSLFAHRVPRNNTAFCVDFLVL